MSELQPAAKEVLAALEQNGLLLQQDKLLPNVVTLVAGESVAGSWWSHPKGRLIFAVLSELADHPDVLLVKLVNAKVTLVHRRLWPALLAAASKGDPWQLRGLSRAAARLLSTVNESSEPVAVSGAAVKQLETRLLVHTEQVHSESGRHVLLTQTWTAWARQKKVKPAKSTAAGRLEIERAVERLGGEAAVLPWNA